MELQLRPRWHWWYRSLQVIRQTFLYGWNLYRATPNRLAQIKPWTLTEIRRLNRFEEDSSMGYQIQKKIMMCISVILSRRNNNTNIATVKTWKSQCFLDSYHRCFSISFVNNNYYTDKYGTYIDVIYTYVQCRLFIFTF